ncbi:MAG: hypothetical protein H7289_07750 [Mucilaginibacter sp.]|nr:hypothetical protein [Mucilaginibacter sp.]
MEYSTKPQIIGIKAACSRLGIESADLALDYSDRRTEHISQLYKDEAAQLVKWLLNQQRIQPSPKEQMTRKVLSMAHELHWELRHAPRPGKSNKIDMAKVDDWCIRFGQFHKPLNQHTETELPKLVTQFQHVHKDFLKGVK